MEVEFLSNMRYALLASSEQWNEFLDKLASYYVFCERITKAPSPSVTLTLSPTLVIPSPTVGNCLSPISSPTTYQSSQSAPRATHGGALYSPPTLANPAPYSDLVSASGASLARRTDLSGRKRSWEWDEQSMEQPAKRPYPGPVASAPKPASDGRRLPVPSLTLNTGSQAPMTQAPYVSTNYSVPQATSYAVSLPPLDSGMRAMSTVYAPTTTASWAAAPTMTSSTPSQQHVGPLVTPTSQYPPASNAAYGTPTKRLSPTNTLTPAAAYNTSSPLHEYPQGSGFHTPISHSPSIYLQHRHSPYKPIRNVRTLLNPPPPSSLQNYQLPTIQPSQMHYQPIGRRNDERTGIVPEYRSQHNHGGNPQYTGITQYGAGSHYNGAPQYGMGSQYGGSTHYGGNTQCGGSQQTSRPPATGQHRYPDLMN